MKFTKKVAAALYSVFVLRTYGIAYISALAVTETVKFGTS